ncbi:MAG: PEP-CTERM sorting domain-containing protein [Pirellulales bacterium]
MARSLIWAILGVLVSFGTGNPAAAEFTVGAPQRVGTITSGTLDEVSGLAASRSNPDTLWVHNDSGDTALFFAMSHAGDLLGTFQLAGMTARDWEDIAIGPKSDGGNYLYLGDVGDNDAVRSSISVHRVVEPSTTAGGSLAVGSYQTLFLKYPNGARDVESIFVDPVSEEMFFITKRRLIPEVYSVPVSAFDTATETMTLTSQGTFLTLPFGATAADISPDGRFILVRTSSAAPGRLYERLPGQSVVDAFQSGYTPFALGPESQGEAIGWAADGKSFYTTSEFDGRPTAPIHSYAFTVPEPATWWLLSAGGLTLIARRQKA